MTDPLSVSSRMLLSLAMFLESFWGCFGTSSGTEGPSLVNLAIPVEERTRDTVASYPGRVGGEIVLRTTSHVLLDMLWINFLRLTPGRSENAGERRWD